MQTCQDNYSTVFSSFGEMQTYHQRLSKESQWRRCRVRDLTIEPLDSKSPLAEDLPAFAPGTSQEAVRDTIRGLGLAMRVEGNLYPMRDTAYKSLLDRAKLRGSVLPKLSRPKLARTLNDCLHVFTSDALVLIRDEKVAAAHSGEPADYAVLPADELLEVLQAKLDRRFPGNQFETGYWDHTLTRAIWTLPGQKEELLRTYQQELAARGKTGVESRLTPAVQFLTSDIGVSSAKVIALLEGGKTPIHIGSCVAVDHRCWAKVEDFDKSLDQLFAQFQDSVEKLQKLLNVYLDYPVNAMTRVCKKLNLPKKAALEAIHQFEVTYGGGPATAHDVFLAMQEISFFLSCDHAPESKLLAVAESLARALSGGRTTTWQRGWSTAGVSHHPLRLRRYGQRPLAGVPGPRAERRHPLHRRGQRCGRHLRLVPLDHAPRAVAHQEGADENPCQKQRGSAGDGALAGAHRRPLV